jgi:hypothetical protein
LGLPRRAMDGLDQTAARDAKAEAIPQQRRDLAVREAAPFIQQHRERDRLRTQLRGGRAERIRRLQGMPTLHAPPTLRAPADVHMKGPHQRTLHRELFLILRRDPGLAHGAVTVRTLRRQRGVVRLVNVRGPRPMGATPICGPRLSTGSRRLGHAGPAREGRRLTGTGAPCGVELLFQLLVFAPQPLPLGFRPAQIVFESLDASRLVVNDLLRILWRGVIALRHAPVMPDSRAQYKREMRVSSH